jgi:hypothetical protein
MGILSGLCLWSCFNLPWICFHLTLNHLQGFTSEFGFTTEGGFLRFLLIVIWRLMPKTAMYLDGKWTVADSRQRVWQFATVAIAWLLILWPASLFLIEGVATHHTIHSLVAVAFLTTIYRWAIEGKTADTRTDEPSIEQKADLMRISHTAYLLAFCLPAFIMGSPEAALIFLIGVLATLGLCNLSLCVFRKYLPPDCEAEPS